MRTYKQDALKYVPSPLLLWVWIVSALVPILTVSRRLVPFMLIVLVAEEVVPFIALYLPRMLPSTCVLPGQRNRITLKARTSQLQALCRDRQMYELICKEHQQSGFVLVQGLKDPVKVCRYVCVVYHFFSGFLYY